MSDDIKCNLTPIDQGDPNSIQLAQLDMIRCQTMILEQNHRTSMNTVRQVHNDSLFVQNKILETLTSIVNNKKFNFVEMIGWIICSLLFVTFVKMIGAVAWYITVQKSDRIAELLILLSNLKARWWNSALPVYESIEHYRSLQPIPTLLVVVYCCRCYKQPITRDNA